MKKRIISILLLTCMLVSALVGCGNEKTPEKAEENSNKFVGIFYKDPLYVIDRTVEEEQEFTEEVVLYKCVDDDYEYRETLDLKAGKTQIVELPFSGGYTYDPIGSRYVPMTIRIGNVYINVLLYPKYIPNPEQ